MKKKEKLGKFPRGVGQVYFLRNWGMIELRYNYPLCPSIDMCILSDSEFEQQVKEKGTIIYE